KAALRNAAMQRHLAAFKPATTRIATTRLLALVAGAGGFAEFRADTATDAHFAEARASGRLQIREADARLFLLFFGCFLSHGLFHHLNQMTNFVNHAADSGRVVAFDNLMHSSQAEAANGLAHIIGAADEADDPLNPDLAAFDSGGFFLRAHAFVSLVAAFSLGGLPLISSMVLDRVSATCAASFNPSSAAKVALITLCGFDVPMDLVSTL